MRSLVCLVLLLLAALACGCSDVYVDPEPCGCPCAVDNCNCEAGCDGSCCPITISRSPDEGLWLRKNGWTFALVPGSHYVGLGPVVMLYGPENYPEVALYKEDADSVPTIQILGPGGRGKAVRIPIDRLIRPEA